MFSYNNIPVTINGEVHMFNYEYLEQSDIGRECLITSEGMMLIIEEDFTVIRTDMPGNWVDPAINALKNLLANQQTLH